MAAWSTRKLARDVFLKRAVSNQLPGIRCFSSAPEIAPKIGHYSKKDYGKVDTSIQLIDELPKHFVKTMAEGKDYCERKINLLKSNFDQPFEVTYKKKNVADEAGVILQAELNQLASSS